MYSIKIKLFTISLALLLCLGVAFALYSIATTMTYQSLRLEGIRKSIKFEAEMANSVITLFESGVLQLATAGLLFHISQSNEIGEVAALELLRSFPTALGGGFWFKPYTYNKDTFRMGIHAFFDKDEGRMRLDYISEDYDYHNTNWYSEIIENIQLPDHVVWIRPYIDDTTDSLIITAGAGIFNSSGDLLGISIIDREIEDVVRRLYTIKPTEHSLVLLYDAEHDYTIANTYTNSSVFPQIIPVNVSGLRIPHIVDLASKTWQSAYDVGVSLVTVDGVRHLALSRILNNGWNLLVYIPMDEIFIETDRRNTRFTLIITLINVIIMCFAYLLISKIIYLPIRKLTSSVAQISLGNLNVRAEVFSKDEIGMLARAFNKMTADLQESIEAYTREHAEKERISAELNIAAEIQSGMLPGIFPPFPDRSEFDIYATMHPAKEVGGDLYDFFFVDNNNLAVVIADVSGKGVPAALFMAVTKALLENNASSNKSPGEVMEAVNKTLCKNNDTGMFVTAFMGYYNTANGRFVFVNAGHNPPLVKKGGSYTFLKTTPCNILGWKETAVYTEEEITLEPGDVLYLYTDGVTEAMNEDGDFFCEPRFLEVSNKNKDLPPVELLSAVKQEIENFAAGAEQADDITMLALEINHYKDNIKELTVAANINCLNEAMDFIEEELNRHNCPQALQNDIAVAIEEIFTNIANYAYKPSAGNVSMYITVKNAEAVIRFGDSGKPYNPLEQPAPDLDIHLMDREIGGLGVFLVQQLMDKVRYVRLDNKNILTITKKI